ncbi:hypothetical protein EYF80_049670 [Liparis tanakae]|uniref:Uncharacterized protein n=1 Tax=Liparis tanakae TaxID=230148 RepID=A0A4Z2FGV6_9TELE|nr:hypothetical protein EYF80_049670 [Liparis tanakae]
MAPAAPPCGQRGRPSPGPGEPFCLANKRIELVTYGSPTRALRVHVLLPNSRGTVEHNVRVKRESGGVGGGGGVVWGWRRRRRRRKRRKRRKPPDWCDGRAP